MIILAYVVLKPGQTGDAAQVKALPPRTPSASS